ncbi:hypothetical protein, partial [Paenibacillus sp.]|uniref:hypothetical protein n=1 Tax=Paenibacillus sp. TaxID=58172 RepID=UPI00283A9A85
SSMPFIYSSGSNPPVEQKVILHLTAPIRIIVLPSRRRMEFKGFRLLCLEDSVQLIRRRFEIILIAAIQINAQSVQLLS